jgi:Polyketide cyclase / dehydrase and lipid transport
VLKKIIAVLLLAIVGLVGFAATKPDNFQIVRSIEIKAPPEKIFARINDLGQWDTWSPWAKIDPAMTKSVSAQSAGKGATYEWSGNKEVGKGKMLVIESQPSSLVQIQLDFIEPFKATNQTFFSLKPAANGTTVEWKMTGESPLISKIVGLFFDMDKSVGGDFVRGLENLKKLSES